MSHELSMPVETVFEISLRKALCKRDRIIERFGDDGGIRNSPDYLRMLIEEEVVLCSISSVCEEIGNLTEGVQK